MSKKMARGLVIVLSVLVLLFGVATGLPSPATAEGSAVQGTDSGTAPTPVSGGDAPPTGSPQPGGSALSASPEPTTAAEPSASPVPTDGGEATPGPQPTQSPEPGADAEPPASPEPTADTDPSVTPEPSASPEPSAEPVSAPDVYKVLLPTAESLAFLLDPLGLTGIAPGEGASLDELDGGKIYSLSPYPAVILNESSMPVRVTVRLTASALSGGGEPARFVSPEDSDLAQAKEAVFSGEAHNILLYAVPSAIGVSHELEPYAPADYGYVITEDTAELTFELPAAEFASTGAFGGWELIPGTASGMQLRIGGFVNTGANWSGFTEETGGAVSVTAQFLCEPVARPGEPGNPVEPEMTAEAEAFLAPMEAQAPQEPVQGIGYLPEAQEAPRPPQAVALDGEALEAILATPYRDAEARTYYLPIHGQ